MVLPFTGGGRIEQTIEQTFDTGIVSLFFGITGVFSDSADL